MKKLTYLFLALIIVACSDDDSDSNQLFLEKYDSVVWEFIEHDNLMHEWEKIAFIESPKTFTGYSEYDVITCETFDLEGTTLTENGPITLTIQEETENSLTILAQYQNYPEWNGVTIFTVTNDANRLSQGSEEGQSEDILLYARTVDEVCF
jgi:hypothetical protein